jgi:hypothetical protein
MGEIRNVHKIMVGKPEVKRPFGRPRRTWEDNIKTDLWERVSEGVEWMYLAQDRVHWWVLESKVMNLRVP